jgi:hypothetical protein
VLLTLPHPHPQPARHPITPTMSTQPSPSTSLVSTFFYYPALPLIPVPLLAATPRRFPVVLPLLRNGSLARLEGRLANLSHLPSLPQPTQNHEATPLTTRTSSPLPLPSLAGIRLIVRGIYQVDDK